MALLDREGHIMIEVPLSRGQVALIDDEDADFIFQYQWYAQWQPCIRGYYASRAGISINGNQPMIYMHRVLMGARKGQRVDHINMDSLDNRRSNLRFVSRSVNQINSKPYSTNRSGYKGVCVRKNGYRAELRYNHIRIISQQYDTSIDAALLRDALVREWIAEEVYLNFPDEHPQWAILEAKQLIAQIDD